MNQQNDIKKTKHVSGWRFVPFLEYINGLIHDFAGGSLTTIFKTFGASNEVISGVWLLQLPLGFKALWAPVVDRWGPYRASLLQTMFLCSLLIFVLGGIFYFMGGSNLWLIALVFFIMIVIMSFLEVAVKGFKLSALRSDEIAYFSGISAAFFRLGLMTGSGFLTYLVGVLERSHGYAHAWGYMFAGSGIALMLLLLYLKLILPRPVSDAGVGGKLTPKVYVDVFKSFLTQNGAWFIIAFIFFSRVGEGMLKVMQNPFVLDPVDKGGMGIDLKILGIMAPFALMSLVVSGIIGGIVVRYFGLRRTIFWIFPLMFVPNLLWSWLAYAQPGEVLIYPITFWGLLSDPWMFEVQWYVFACGILEIVGYGVALAPVLVLIDYVAKNSGVSKGTFGAIGGSLLLLGFVGAGGTSGFIQSQLGYFWLFNISFIISIPAWILILFLPLREIEDKAKEWDRLEDILPENEGNVKKTI